ncbi:hypothetical protein C2G38_2174013 [Gigaspora rosea]|uniref:Serine-threonine/tyrosine-protein kinase catalytic domain-containing protein n=1 Tax=Gigaspora rosea TaxID=44941 RepID=A0A397VIW2_9GLOM|nr:hypothetical protein C2G38_2174013 [Gigaspora rosea]
MYYIRSSDIHSHDLIHCNLHSRNILLNSLKSTYITDLELSISTKSKSNGIFEILNGKPVPFEETSKFQSKLQLPIHENTATCYADLIKKCWNAEPENDQQQKKFFIPSNNYYEETKTYELEIPDDIDE